jgi:hypothetical protein
MNPMHTVHVSRMFVSAAAAAPNRMHATADATADAT